MSTNEMRFFGDRGDGTVEELASIGISEDGSDSFIGKFGSQNAGNSRIALSGLSYSAVAISGLSMNASGVRGISINDIGVSGYGGTYGVLAQGSTGPIVLIPSESASAPTHTANPGTLWVTSAGVLYINTNGTTWQKVGGQ